MPKIRHGHWMGALAVVTVAGAAPAAQAQREAKVYSITVWNAGCGGAQRDAWDDMANAWYDEITNAGVTIWLPFVGNLCAFGHCGDAYSRDGQITNGMIANSWFADASVVAWGQDTGRLDEADAALIATHGFDSGGDYGGTMRIDQAGDGDCNMMRSEMQLGDTDLEFLHLSSCNSMDSNMWTEWWRAFRGVHQVNGFHGFMWIGGGLVGNYRNFASDAFDGAISTAWTDNHYVIDVNGAGTWDQCPVSYAVGSSAADAQNRLFTERYNNVFSDPNTINWWWATWTSPCAPQNETAL